MCGCESLGCAVDRVLSVEGRSEMSYCGWIVQEVYPSQLHPTSAKTSTCARKSSSRAGKSASAREGESRCLRVVLGD